MDESEDNLSSEDMKSTDSPMNVKTKPKKRSLIERELETSLTARVTSPLTNGDGTNTSRYGRARRLKSEMESADLKKTTAELKSPLSGKSPLKAQTQSPVYKMHASNSPVKRTKSPQKVVVEKYLDDQIESIYQENISLSRFGNEEVSTVTPSPAKKFPKVYIRKDLIQKREPEETIMVIKNLFSPVKSAKKSKNTHLNNILERSSDRYSLNSKQNGYVDNSSVVKTLDFDSKKKKKETKEVKVVPSKSELFDVEAKCMYQVGDLAWARMGTYPFWPCIVTRDPAGGVFVKKKLFGRIERDIIHVTFFGDNGRRGWIVDSMLRKYLGQLEFETARENFTPEAKKKDPRLYAAFFISEKKQALWTASVEEAEMLLREPKRLRIDIFNEMLEKSRSSKAKQPKSKMCRTDSDVSLSESLYDSLFSEEDGKSDSNDRSRNRSRNKSLDMFDVVTACLDNMAAKTGITKIQRQSHMDRWLQKAKSKTPEKTKVITQVPSKKLDDKQTKVIGSKRKTSTTKRTVKKTYSLRKSSESRNVKSDNNENDDNVVSLDENITDSDHTSTDTDSSKQFYNGIGIISKVESLAEKENNSKNEDTTQNESETTGSPKESSEEMNGTCDSETYTDDESRDYSSIDNVASTCTTDKEELAKDLAVEESNTDTESKFTSQSDKDSRIDIDVKSQSSTESKNSSEDTTNTDTEEITSQDETTETPEKVSDTETDNVTDENTFTMAPPSSDFDAETEDTNESQNSSESNFPKETSTDTSNNGDTQSTEIESTIATDNSSQERPNVDTEDKKYIEASTQQCEEKSTINIHTNKDIEEDEMSIDDDSDSERLPYSPLSNLGNNSDDNLSLDNVPFANEIEKQDGGPENKIDGLIEETNEVINQNYNDISKEDINIEINKSKLIKKGKLNESVEIDKSVTETTLQNVKILEPKKPDTEATNKHKIDNNAQIKIDSITGNGYYRGKNVREIEMAAKEVTIYVSDGVPQAKLNGFHDMNGGIDLETASVRSEDSVSSTRSQSRRKLRKEDKNENPLDNPEFVKYMELRQDAIMDENPELSEKDIVAYLYKTWQYEESFKSDVKKNDDLRECNLVKGLNQGQTEAPARSKRNLSLNKPQKSNRNTLQRFLRRNKDLVSKSDDMDDEICFFKRRGVKKNMIKYDDDDEESSEQSKEHESHRNTHKSVKENKSELKQKLVNGNDGVLESPVITNSNKNQRSTEIQNAGPENEYTGQTTNTEESTKKIEKLNYIAKETGTIRTPTIDRIKEDFDGDSLDSEDSETPLIRCKLRSKGKKKEHDIEGSVDGKIKEEDADTVSINSEDSEISVTKRKKRFGNKKIENAMDDPEFVKYLELRQDAIIDENPQLSQDEITAYLYQTWLYEENQKSEIKKTDEIEQSSLVKGLNDGVQIPKKIKRKIFKTEKAKDIVDDDTLVKDKPKRKSVKPFYNEEYSDIEEELEVFEIFKPKNKEVPKEETGQSVPETAPLEQVEVYDEVELYFAELTKPKPNIFKGLVREKVCEICEKVGSLVKCKGCNGMFHVDCVKKQVEVIEVPAPTRGRKKKKKPKSKQKTSEEFDNDEKSQDVSEENNASVEEIIEADSRTVDADVLEAQLSAKMKEILDTAETIEYDSYTSDDGIDWNETVPGKCEIIDVKLKPRHSISEIDYSDFKCNNCQKYTTPICFVCKGAVSKKESTKRQKCHVAHCHKYYHLECLDQWPQTHFNGGEPSKTNKKINEYFEALTCPRHVCHTCVSDDPRGCKTRFSGDKLARCVRCPATYHSFTKCLPAGTQILTASHIICPRHYEHRPGKVPCHVNTGWCFICALGGSLICCEYCPTSFHAECLNIDPPEGGYMCEDCETGRLPLYGEMVWVKLGHYRWWPGIILHPYEIPENLLAVKHSLGEFVVRFFGQYDHYWVNRGRVFPFQEGDSGRISSQKSKIDAAFTTAMEHAQRACEILKTAQPNEEESLDIASSLLPPHYVKLKVNKPCGSLCGRKLEDPESSLTQCECNPLDADPCGPYSQCLNRMLLTECGPTCRAGDRCNNRAFEKRLYPKLVPYRTPSRGWGLKTLEDIKAGQFVIEYVGELIDEEEFRRRMRRKHEIRDENFYFLTLDKERMIDAGPKGNLARFMNHCCEPNCETQKWTVLGDVRVGLFALYDIPAHSEVTFNYNLECAGIDKKRCMCGAKRCSGYIGAKPKQDESQSKKKLHPGKRTYKKRKPEESPSTKNKPKRPIGRPPKPKELTEIEKDLLIIRNATNGLSSDESSRSLSSEFDRNLKSTEFDKNLKSTEFDANPKALKRKRVSFSSEEVILYDGTESPNVKKAKLDDRIDGE